MKYYLVFLILWICCPALEAQYPYYRNFNSNDGLPSNKVYNIIEDRYGFIWVSTDQGVSRYDGVSFANFSDQDGLPDNDVLSLHEDGRGRIWFNSFSSRLSYYWKGKIYNAGNDSFLKRISLHKPPGFMYIIVQYNNSAAFLINENGRQLIIGKDIEDIEIKAPHKLPSALQQCILYFKEGSYYLHTFMDIYSWKPGVTAKHTHFDRLYMNESSLPGTGIYGFNEAELEVCRLDAGHAPVPVLKTGSDCKNIFSGAGWHALCGDSSYIIYDKTMSMVKETVRLPFAIKRIFIDRRGNKWFGSFDKGIYMIRQYAPLKMLLPEGKEQGILDIASDSQTLFLSTEKNGLLIRDMNKHCTTLPGSDKWDRVKAFGSNSRYYFIACDKGVFRMDKTLSDRKHIITRLSIKDMEPGNKEEMLFTAGSVAFLYTNDTILPINAKASAICQRDSNRIWLGTIKGIEEVQYKGFNFAIKPLKLQADLDDSRIVDIKKDRLGNMWVATDHHGLFLIAENKQVLNFNTDAPAGRRILSGACLQVRVADDDNIWLATTGGLSLLRYTGKSDYTVLNYSLPEGIPGKTVNTVTLFNKQVLIATFNGLFRFPRLPEIKNEVGATVITGIKVNNMICDISSPELAYDQNNLVISYASSFINTRTDYLFRYRVRGLSPVWIETNTLEVPLIGMEPGNYVFEITALNALGDPGPVSTFSFSISPPWFEQWWFISLVVLISVCSLLYYFRLLRSRISMAKNLVLFRLRVLRAQMNPHFVFNALSNIQRLVHINANREAESYIGTLASVMRRSIDYSAREFVRLDEEITYTKQYMDIEALRFGERFEWSISVAPGNEERNSIYVPPMILQPLLENTIKHAFKGIDYKGMVEITVDKISGDMLRYIIKDNGVGFNMEEVPNDRYGLAIIRERIALLYKHTQGKAGVKISSSTEKPGSGTIVIITIPTLQD